VFALAPKERSDHRQAVKHSETPAISIHVCISPDGAADYRQVVEHSETPAIKRIHHNKP